MKSNLKIKTSFIIFLGFIFALSTIIFIDFYAGIGYGKSDYSDNITLDTENLKLSAISGKIHIDNNWSATEAMGICTGNGTYSEPYIIEDLIIDAGGPGSCILIENSTEFFKIENCTLYNSGLTYIIDGGIKLTNVRNGVIIDNNCSANYKGIYVENSININITGNTLNNNDDDGIHLWYCRNSTVSGNTVNSNGDDGIYLQDNCNNITVSGNTINNNGDDGIYIWICNDNTITGNTANNNTSDGIYLRSSDNNIVSGNTLIGNDNCIVEELCSGNEFSDNGSCTYGEGEGDKIIPGFNLFFILGICSVLLMIIIVRKNIKNK